ncbi:MAG TPA: hypothetical protein VGC88_10870 [Terriglobales bacterium]|jgi:CheY-like chemotaxis protein
MPSSCGQAAPRQLILLIGSDAPFLASRQRVIESGGCDVVFASSQEQAIAVLHNHVFDLVVASHALEGDDFDGLEELLARDHPETLLLRLAPQMPVSDERYITDAMPDALLDAVTAILSTRHERNIHASDVVVDRRRNREPWSSFVEHLLAEGFVVRHVDGVRRLTSPDGNHFVVLPSDDGVERRSMQPVAARPQRRSA